MNDQYVKNVIEAALLAAGRPLTLDELVSVFDERDGSNAEEVRSAADVEALLGRDELHERGQERREERALGCAEPGVLEAPPK